MSMEMVERELEAFITYREADGHQDELEQLLRKAHQALGNLSIRAYCDLLEEKTPEIERLSEREKLDRANAKLDHCDFMLAIHGPFVKDEGPFGSEYMDFHVGLCWAREIPIIVASHESIEGSRLPELTTKPMEPIIFSSLYDLKDKIEEYNFADIPRR